MTDPITRLRPAGAIRFYKLRHRDGCCGSDDPEICSCGAADAMAKVRDLQESEDADRGDRNG